jgi:hypothetical protein
MTVRRQGWRCDARLCSIGLSGAVRYLDTLDTQSQRTSGPKLAISL